MAIFNELIKCRSGATSIEYAIMASMLSIVIIAGLLLLGNNNKDSYANVADQVGEAMDNSPPTP